MRSDLYERGPRFISGEASTGRVRLRREDGSVAMCGVIMIRGELVDNGDSTFDIVPPEEE